MFPAHCFINIKRNRQTIQCSDGGGFGGSHDAAVNAAENNHRHDQSRESEASVLGERFPGHLFGGRFFNHHISGFVLQVVEKLEMLNDAEENDKNDSGNYCGQEASQNRLTGTPSKEHLGGAGRNQKS